MTKPRRETTRTGTGRASRRRFLWGVGAGSSALTLAGCIADDNGDGDDDTGDGVDDDDTDDDDDDDDADDDDFSDATVTITAVWTDAEQEAFEQVVDFAEEETGIDIVYEPRDGEDIRTGTLMDYEAGSTPADIVVMASPGRILRDGGEGHLEDVSDVWDPEDYAAEPDPVSDGDGVFAAPMKMDLKPGFWYRQSFFDEHGLSEPESYDEFMDLLEEIDGIDGVDAPLASGNGTGWPLSDVTEAYIFRQDNGVETMQQMIEGETGFDNDAARSALEEVQETLQEGYWSDLRNFAVQYEHWWENSIPLYFMGSWTPGSDPIDDNDDLGIFTLPGAEGMTASVNWFTVPTYGENVEATKEVLRAIVSAEGQEVWTRLGGFNPSHLDVPRDAFEFDIMPEVVELADDLVIVPDLDDALGDPFQSSFWAQLIGLWQEPDSDLDDIIESLDDAMLETHQEEDE